MTRKYCDLTEFESADFSSWAKLKWICRLCKVLSFPPQQSWITIKGKGSFKSLFQNHSKIYVILKIIGIDIEIQSKSQTSKHLGADAILFFCHLTMCTKPNPAPHLKLQIVFYFLGGTRWGEHFTPPLCKSFRKLGRPAPPAAPLDWLAQGAMYMWHLHIGSFL